MVGVARFELTTPCAQGRCATRLRYTPTRCAEQTDNSFLDGGDSAYTVLAEAPAAKVIKKSYSDNFKFGRSVNWTH